MMKKILCAVALASLLSACGFSDGDENALPETFAKQVAEEKYLEAIGGTIGANPWGGVTPDTLTDFTQNLTNTIKQMGAYKFHERVDSQAIGSRWKKVTYLMGFERQPLLLVFSLYKPADEWVVMDISFHQNFTINNGQIVLN
jgi:hypothetical protein